MTIDTETLIDNVEKSYKEEKSIKNLSDILAFSGAWNDTFLAVSGPWNQEKPFGSFQGP